MSNPHTFEAQKISNASVTDSTATPEHAQSHSTYESQWLHQLGCYKTLGLTSHDDTLIVTLRRPDKKNAMNFEMMRELIAVAERINNQKDIRAVIITGAGESFCSGIDLNDLNRPNQQAFALWQLIKPWQSLFQRACLIWRDLCVPVIAVLHGHCLGAGLQLALAADIRISDPECQMAIMEAKWGLVPDMGITQSAVGVVRADTLKELAMSARMIDGHQAYELGVVSHLHDAPLIMAQTLAKEFATRSPDAVLASKRIINQMNSQSALTSYQEKFWQLKLLLGHNRKIALKKAKDASLRFRKRQFK